MGGTTSAGRRRRRLLLLGTAASATLALSLTEPASAVSTNLVLWQMNERAGARVMVDSSVNRINGTIGTAVRTGVVSGRVIGYRWATTPNTPPAQPRRLITVKDDARLDPGIGNYAVTVRFRTTQSLGNLIQKGQATVAGGYYKMSNANGRITCLFRGSNFTLSKAVNSGLRPLNDGAWHTVRCERTINRVVMTIDGVRKRQGNGPTGNIANAYPVSIGGKSKCNQVKVTCDYFAGDIDYVRIDKG